MRKYGLFEMRDDGKRYQLFPTLTYKKSSAVKIFQSALLAPYLGGAKFPRELRPMSVTQLDALEQLRQTGVDMSRIESIVWRGRQYDINWKPVTAE